MRWVKRRMPGWPVLRCRVIDFATLFVQGQVCYAAAV
jgi:hypothetical protein